MKKFVFGICVLVLLLTLASNNAMAAGKPPKAVDIPITQEIADSDGSSVYNIESDGTGVYTDGLAGGVTGDVSVLMSNVYNGLTYGDRLLDLQSAQVRKVKITLDITNALQPGDYGYLVPAQPLGTVFNSVRMMNKCTAENKSMFTMMPGDKIFCEMHLLLSPFSGTSNYYRLDMGTIGEAETEEVQITCNASGADGKCNDWVIEPSSNPDYTVNPGVTRARLNYFVTKGKGQATVTNMGAFYMTFRIYITRP